MGLHFFALRHGSYTQIVYAPSGAKLALMNGQSLVKAFIPLPGQATAVYTSSGLDHYQHSDWLGSVRLTSSPSQTYTGSLAYAPFGETYASNGTPDSSFTGQNPDTISTDYDFLMREYSNEGRWPSPDPAGLAAANPANPQSLNRYAYVLNNPMNFVDRLGLGPCTAQQRADGDCGHQPNDAAVALCWYNTGGLCGGGPTFGNDIFDAIAGAPGTFTYYDIYGNFSWGFSQDLYQAFMNLCQITNCLSMSGWNYDIHDLGAGTVASGFLADKIASAEQANWLNGNFPGSIDTIASYINVQIKMLLNNGANPQNIYLPKIIGFAVSSYLQQNGISGDWGSYFYQYFNNLGPVFPPQ